MNRAFYTIEGIAARVSIADHPGRVQPVVTVVTPEPVESYEHAIIEVSPEGARVENLFIEDAPLHQSLDDSIGSSDSSLVEFEANKSDSISLADSVAAGFEANKSDSITLSEALAVGTGVNKSDSVLPGDDVALLVEAAKSDSIATSDALQSVDLEKPLSDNFSLVESMTIVTNFERAFMSVEVLATDQAAIDTGLSKSDSISLADNGNILISDGESGMINAAMVNSRRIDALAGGETTFF